MLMVGSADAVHRSGKAWEEMKGTAPATRSPKFLLSQSGQRFLPPSIVTRIKWDKIRAQEVLVMIIAGPEDGIQL